MKQYHHVEIGGDIYIINDNIVQKSSAEDVQVNTEASKNSHQSAEESHGVSDQYLQIETREINNTEDQIAQESSAGDLYNDIKATELIRKNENAFHNGDERNPQPALASMDDSNQDLSDP